MICNLTDYHLRYSFFVIYDQTRERISCFVSSHLFPARFCSGFWVRHGADCPVNVDGDHLHSTKFLQDYHALTHNLQTIVCSNRERFSPDLAYSYQSVLHLAICLRYMNASRVQFSKRSPIHVIVPNQRLF